ncbi:MAG: shikimate kinase [Pseudomonadota bacterium]
MLQIESLRQKILGTSLVLIGLMGAGKTALGKRLAEKLEINFVDADVEIEAAAGKSVEDIFSDHGEEHFRQGEQRVIERLLKSYPQVLATGGGAYMNAQTRQRICENGISIWLKADLDILMERVMRRSNRPLLQTDDPESVMKNLIEERYPIYALADITIESRNVPHEAMIEDIVTGLETYLKNKT